MKPRRLIIATGLCAALLAVAASSASAVVFSPPSLDFRPQPTMTKSPGQTLTLTKQGTFEALALYFIPERFKGYSNINAFDSISDCPEMLTDSVPSCTVTVFFTPTIPGGPQVTTLFTDGLSDPSLPSVRVTGAATKPCYKKKSSKRVRYKKKCKGFPFYDPTDYGALRDAGAIAP